MNNKKHSEESKEKMRQASIRNWQNPDFRMKQKNKKILYGKDVHNWSGDNPDYYTLHAWIRNRLGSAWMCEQCGKDDDGSRYEWSNIDGKYRRDLNDYIMLCVSCHRKRDNSLNIRHKKDLKINLDAARLYATLSYANRLKVGSVLLQDGHIISNGRNGTPTGQDNKCEDEEGNTLPSVIHAESNSILFAAKNGIATNGATMVITHSPCFECSKLIIQSGIKEVYYDEEYRDISPIDFLKSCGIKVEKINGTA